jgi:hypothetical protein
MLIPLEYCQTGFKSILNLNMISFREEMMKKIDILCIIDSEKLKKMAWFCRRFQIQKGQIIIKDSHAENYTIILISG